MFLSDLMVPTVISRRAVLKYSSAATVLAATGGFSACSRSSVAYLSAARSRGGHYFAVLLNAQLDVINRTPLPQRAHAAVFNPVRREALFFSRRPGAELFVVDAPSSKVVKIVSSEAGRHFYGHGVLSRNGEWLFATENAYASGKGVISIREASRQYASVREIDSYGVGPHELALMSDGRTLVVANGGLKTHPEKNRVVLNAESMQPNISFIDWQSGKLLAQYQPPHHKMSLRHLSVDEEDNVFVAAQYHGKVLDDVPLLLQARLETELEPFHENNFSIQQKQYSASVCARDNNVLLSCPKGNALTLWQNGNLRDALQLKDIAGISPGASPSEFVFSSGRGQLGRVQVKQGKLLLDTHSTSKELQWDNHLVAV